MTVINRRDILRRSYRDRRSFVARAMGLSPIGDIASGGMTELGGPETITWSTATDWNNASDQSGTVAASFGDQTGDDVIRQGYEPAWLPSEAAGFWHLDEDSGSVAADQIGGIGDGSVSGTTQGEPGILDTTSYLFPDSNSDYVDTGNLPDITGQGAAMFGCIWIRDTAIPSGDDSQNIAIAYDGNTDDYWGFRLLNDDTTLAVGHRDPSTGNFTTNSSGVVPNEQEWYTFSGILDQANNDLILHVNGNLEATISDGQFGNDLNFGSVGVPWTFGTEGLGRNKPYDGRLDNMIFFDGAPTSSEMERVHDAVNNGYLTTATKSFSSTSEPDLQNLQYSLNSQAIDLDVIGSPGTASEEVVTQTLDGASSYSLTWSSGHTDFRIQIKPSTTDVTTSATVNQVELIA